MDREGAETFPRLLAEAELRDPQPPQRHAGGATDFSFFSVPATVRRAAWALVAVQALDVETADSTWPIRSWRWPCDSNRNRPNPVTPASRRRAGCTG